MKSVKMDAKKIKRLIRRSELYGYQVAAEIGISVPTLTTWYRSLDDKRTELILNAIEQLIKRGDVNDR